MKRQIFALPIFTVFAFMLVALIKPLDTRGNTPYSSEQVLNAQTLVEAARNGELAEVQRLIIEEKIQPDLIYNGNTALVWAVWRDHKEMLTFLLSQKDVNINRHNKIQETPLIIASRRGSVNTVRQLLKAGAEVSAQNTNQQTALSVAAINNHKEIISILHSAGANLEHPSHGGTTPLMLAAERGNMESAVHLLTLGATPNTKDVFQHTAHDRARQYKHDAMTILLNPLNF